MRLICSCILSLLFAASTFAQSHLKIDKLDRKDIATAVKEVPFSTLLEGTVDDPDLAVFVLVRDPEDNGWLSFPATVDETRVDPAGGYRWRAICHFGDFDGESVGASYKVRVIAIKPEHITPGDVPGSLSAAKSQTEDIVIKRVKK